MWNADLHFPAYLSLQGHSVDSLTRKLEVERSQAYRKRLEHRARVCHIHVEVLLPDTAKLHVNMVVVVLINQLEIFNRRFINAPIEV